MKSEKQSEIGFYTRTLNGHRQSYLDFVKKVFGGNRVEGISLILRKQPLLFLMIEDNFLLYFIVGCIRALLGRRTAGLLFRPKPALEASNYRLKLKLMMLKFLKKIKSVRTLSIVPTPLEPSISEIVDDWIYDFQLWDITKEQKDIFQKIRNGNTNFKDMKEYEIANNIKNHASGRKILIALGVQNKGKGVHILSQYIDIFNQLDYLVVVAGRFDEVSAAPKKYLQNSGALVFDRFMTDEEILALYSVADVVWCYYDASYDQSSGILGRAIQLSVTPIVRKGSFSQLFCNNEKIIHISGEDEINLRQQVINFEESSFSQQQSTYSFESLSLIKLKAALGLGLR